MAGQAKGRKIGRNKRKPSSAAYVAQGRLTKNVKARAAKQERMVADHRAKWFMVRIKRKKGAVARLERRISAGVSGLDETLLKAKAALAAVA